jgi:hypothetical protein
LNDIENEDLFLLNMIQHMTALSPVNSGLIARLSQRFQVQETIQSWKWPEGSPAMQG